MMLLTSCDLLVTNGVLHGHTDNALKVEKLDFSDDYKRIALHLDLTKDLGGIDITDSSKVDIKINDKNCHTISLIKVAQPELKSVHYIAPDDINRTGLAVMVLVDLSQSSPVLKKQKEYVKKMYSLFSRGNLYLAFMKPDGSVTNLMTATDYIVNNYIEVNSPLLGGSNNTFVSMAMDSNDSINTLMQKQYALLYRSVAQTLYAISGHTGTEIDDRRLRSLVIFSDGQVYDEAENMPLDPQHFIIQDKLINLSANLPDNISVYYVNLASTGVNKSVKDSNMMRMLCMRSNGKYYSDFNWMTLSEDILKGFNIHSDDYIMELLNTEGRIFFGNQRNLRIRIYSKGTDKLLAECNKEYTLGSVLHPVIVGNPSYTPIYFSGLLIVALILALVYVVLQFIIPYVRYRIFRNKYVVNYTGPNMSVQGKLVADTCYFCKAPFQVGDSIVAKCQHTMHEECWNENDQHCPEYGKHCPDGSHYYDALNILNPRNGSFYIKWVIMAIIMSSIAWFLMASSYHKWLIEVILWISNTLKASKPDVQDSGNIDVFSAIMDISPRMYMLPLFGLYLTPLLTLLFSALASYHRQWQYRLYDTLVRAFIVLVVATGVFLIEFLTILICDVYDSSFLFDWIPWTIVTYVIIFVSTTHTRICDLHSRTAIIVSLCLGIQNSLLWNLLGTYETKQEIIIFIFFFMLYGIILSVVIARKLPLSEKYFLHVTGEVKEMDIAIYKWLRQTPDAFVTIGRSVDCQLHITWDATSDIAPVHAVIRQNAGVPYIYPLDGSVMVGNRVIPEGKGKRLHHGLTFQIGTTIFTFVEA